MSGRATGPTAVAEIIVPAASGDELSTQDWPGRRRRDLGKEERKTAWNGTDNCGYKGKGWAWRGRRRFASRAPV
jgi:hypothetical protein